MSRKGNILLTMIITMSLTVLAVVFLDLVYTSSAITTSQVDRLSSLYIAEAGLNKAIYYLQNTAPAPDSSSGAAWRTLAYPATTGIVVCPGGACLPVTEDFNNGTYTVWVETSESYIKITSSGLLNGVTRKVQALVKIATRTFIVPGSWKEL